MEKAKRANRKVILIISIIFGYLGIDRFILKKIKFGLTKLISFILSIIVFVWFEEILNLTLKATKNTINYSQGIFQVLNMGSFISTHIPNILGLGVLTILIMLILICGLSVFILWIKDILLIAKKEEIEGIKWV
jgi:TM2 domain-containing membrane protein YozV